MQGSSIILNQVSVRLQGNDLLKDISFALQPGEHLAVTGPSGSGKTMLSRVLAGQLFAQGNLVINWDESTPLQKKVLLVEQRNQFKNLSHTTDFYYQQRFNSFDAGDAETVCQALTNFCTDDNQNRLDSLLKNFGLSERKDAPLIQLSSGENKRFQLIKAILLQPQILVLDSPFTGLDISSRKYLHTVLNELAENGVKIILITDAHQLPGCITHIAVLNEGELESVTAKANWNQDDSLSNAEQSQLSVDSLPLSENLLHYDAIIDMRDVHIQYGDKVILSNINWQVKQGEKWLLKGKNGAGKSTLLSLINGDNPQAYKNEIYLFDKRRGTGESIWDIKSKIGYVSPELHAFYDKQTSCFNTIASGFFDTIGLFKKISPEQQQKVQQWIEALDLTTLQSKALASLSFGTQRLILLARAMVKNPALLILDEPCQGLDDAQRDTFKKLVDDLAERFDKTLIYVSHYDNEIPGCITRVLELSKGESKKYTIKKLTEFA